MQRGIRAAAGLATTFLTAALGCRDLTSPTNQAPLDRSHRSGASIIAPALVAPVERLTPLATDVSWTFVAGPFGAVSRNADVGLTVIIPFGALSSTQTITVTALEGSAVAYRFEPHVTFGRGVTLTQDLSLTRSRFSLLPLLGAHFDGDVLEFTNGLVGVTETLPAITSLLTGTARFDVWHFSGWIVASGRDDGSDDPPPLDPPLDPGS